MQLGATVEDLAHYHRARESAVTSGFDRAAGRTKAAGRMISGFSGEHGRCHNVSNVAQRRGGVCLRLTPLDSYDFFLDILLYAYKHIYFSTRLSPRGGLSPTVTRGACQ